MSQIKVIAISETHTITIQSIGENKKTIQWTGDFSILDINNKTGLNADGIHQMNLFQNITKSHQSQIIKFVILQRPYSTHSLLTSVLIVVQWANVIICKTRTLSLAQQ